MEIGTIFTLDRYAEAHAYAVANKCKIEEIESVMRVVSEEYEELVKTPIKFPAVTHIEIDEDGNKHEIIDQPEHEGIIEEVVVKTREVEKEVRQYQIVAIPEPTVEEKNEQIRKARAALYTKHVDPLHAQKTKDIIMGEWSDEKEQEYIAKVKELTIKIRDENPYIE